MSLLPHALKYASRGWAIIPAKYVNGRKQGAFRWKRYQKASPEVARLKKWFSRDRYPALAVVLGPVSGNLACRDFDDADAYQTWADGHPELAKKLPTVQTGRGFHVYFTAPVEKTVHFADGELRGARSLCVLPPSPHPKGGTYQWRVELPAGELPAIDPAQAGLIPVPVQPKRTEDNRETTDANGCLLSAEKGKRVISSHPEIENAISATLPTGPGQRHLLVFRFARALKGIPELAGASADSLYPYLRQWHDRAMPYINTKDFDETRIDFLKAWPKITRPLRLNLPEDALKEARLHPIPGLPYESEGIRTLLAWCREMQKIVGEQPFWIAVRTGERLLGVDKGTVSRWLYLLEQDGWIKTIEKGGTTKNPNATRFRFIEERLKQADEKK